MPGILQHESSQEMISSGNVDSNGRRQSMKEQSSQRALDNLIELVRFQEQYLLNLHHFLEPLIPTRDSFSFNF